MGNVIKADFTKGRKKTEIHTSTNAAGAQPLYDEKDFSFIGKSIQGSADFITSRIISVYIVARVHNLRVQITRKNQDEFAAKFVSLDLSIPDIHYYKNAIMKDALNTMLVGDEIDIQLYVNKTFFSTDKGRVKSAEYAMRGK